MTRWFLIGVLALLAVVGCGGSSSVSHLGCGQYCQQAGGYGGAPAGRRVIDVLTTGTVVPLSDGTVPVELHCVIPVPCQGALNLGPSAPNLVTACAAASSSRVAYWAQSDLVVGANSTRVLGIVLTPCARRLLRQYRALTVDLTADSGQVPSCKKIPQLVSECRKFMSSPRSTPDQGDGLIRIVSERIKLANSHG
jgi:hypothetical protein